MIPFDGLKKLFAALAFCILAMTALSAQTFTTLVSFDGANGANPYAGMVQGTDGSFYGTTLDGGAYSSGNVFKIDASGLTTLYDFCAQSNCPDGQYPVSTLVLGRDGELYGTTQNGGAFNSQYGTIFKITRDGTLTTLHSFNGLDGVNPYGALLLAVNGEFYGTATAGGSGGGGTIFSINSNGTFNTLYNFCTQSGCPDGQSPDGNLMQASDGYIYGTAHQGGNYTACVHTGCGTVFRISTSGTFNTLHVFDATDGRQPAAELVEGRNGLLYGSTAAGGANDDGTIYTLRSGTLATLYSFTGPEGFSPGGMILGSDGNFYGTTLGGGSNSAGTVFKVTPHGQLSTVYSFNAAFYYYFGPLTQGTNGRIYGTTYFGGGADNDGTVYSLSAGLRPFVQVQPGAGEPGTTVWVLGNGLAAATGVSFSGVGAAFHIRSNSLITATVPAGSTTGEVEVTGPDGSLWSNVPFLVRQ